MKRQIHMFLMILMVDVFLGGVCFSAVLPGVRWESEPQMAVYGAAVQAEDVSFSSGGETETGEKNHAKSCGLSQAIPEGKRSRAGIQAAGGTVRPAGPGGCGLDD